MISPRYAFCTMNMLGFTAFLLLAASAPALCAETTPVEGAAVEAQAVSGYDKFIELLDKQVEANTNDCGPAVSCAVISNGGDTDAALEWLKRASDSGNAAAQQILSARILQALGDIPEQEEQEALALLKSSADKGFIPAMLDYAILQNSGKGMPQDKAAAERLLDAACQNGDMRACFVRLLETGKFKDMQDLERPEVKAEIERGNHYLPFHAFACFKGDEKERAELLTNAAKLGNPHALFALASATIRTQPTQSFQLLQAAAEKHNEQALFVIGSVLLDPSNFPQTASLPEQDTKSGVVLVKTAYLMSEPESAHALACIYYDGMYGEAADHKKAFRYYMDAYRLHNRMEDAAAAGLMLLKGDGTAQDTQTGWRLLTAAYKANAVNAPILMAYARYEGLGCKADAEEALALLEEASYTPYSNIFQAYIYTQGGAGVEPDPAKAESNLSQARSAMGAKADETYNDMIKAGKWDPHP